VRFVFGGNAGWVQVIRRAITLLLAPFVVPAFFARKTGRKYGIGSLRKFLLFYRIVRNHFKIPTASHVLEHLAMAAAILSIPPEVDGCLVECGTWKGGSAATFSLVAKMCGRRFHVFDSFMGLPEPGPHEKNTYRAGEYAGSLDEVKNNIKRYGDITTCYFHQGYFADTMPAFTERCVFAFIDVDLSGSLRDCLRCLWPQLQTNSYVFTHEARDRRIIDVFFDSSWWVKTFDIAAPGLVGAGSGLGLIPHADGLWSDLAYTCKASCTPMPR
jgi:O-methyltransferase